MQAIRRYLRKYPEEMAEILNYNPSYVFFRKVEEGPLGSISVPLTAGRSIATDPNLFPRGDLFWGNGPYSRIAAGHLKHPGALYFLLVKQ